MVKRPHAPVPPRAARWDRPWWQRLHGPWRALVVAMLVVVGLPVALDAPVVAPAAASDCDGVWVVVDARDAGGSLTTRCAAGDPSSGLEALERAGHGYTFVPRIAGMVCTIDGRPDPCNGAASGAHWSYWSAEDGGSWTYAHVGAGSRDPAPGAVEGWRFGDGSSPPGAAPPGRQPSSSAGDDAGNDTAGDDADDGTADTGGERSTPDAGPDGDVGSGDDTAAPTAAPDAEEAEQAEQAVERERLDLAAGRDPTTDAPDRAEDLATDAEDHDAEVDARNDTRSTDPQADPSDERSDGEPLAAAGGDDGAGPTYPWILAPALLAAIGLLTWWQRTRRGGVVS